jgi:cytochrome c
MTYSRVFALAVLLGHFALSAQAAEVSKGAKLYATRCGTCHSLDRNGWGPAHRGVYGRATGSAPGYRYSAAVKALGGVWDAPRLDAWLTNPRAMAGKTRMITRTPSAIDREDLIAYLRSVSP